PADPALEISLREAQQILHEELARLPERCRAPLVLCCLEGLTRDEAARQLGWSLGTFKRCLQRGRDLLRARLLARGLTLPAALATTLLAEGNPPAAAPATLTAATTRAACHFATATSGSSLSAPAALAEAVLATMTAVRGKAILALL